MRFVNVEVVMCVCPWSHRNLLDVTEDFICVVSVYSCVAAHIQLSCVLCPVYLHFLNKVSICFKTTPLLREKKHTEKNPQGQSISFHTEKNTRPVNQFPHGKKHKASQSVLFVDAAVLRFEVAPTLPGVLLGEGRKHKNEEKIDAIVPPVFLSLPASLSPSLSHSLFLSQTEIC